MPINKNISIRHKSKYQKDECFTCNRDACIELVKENTSVRCCGHPDCINKVEEFLLKINTLT